MTIKITFTENCDSMKTFKARKVTDPKKISLFLVKDN